MSAEKGIRFYFFFVSLFVLLFVHSFLFVGCVKNTNPAEENTSKDKYALFLSSCGWNTSDSPFEVSYLTLPQVFDAVYKRYNDVQLSQGFDLSPYMGKVIQKRVYAVYGYPGREDDETIRADVFVADGIIIAADICSMRIDGFLHGVK